MDPRNWQRMPEEVQRKKFMKGQRWTGLFLLIAGVVLFLKQSGYPMPEWLFTWPVILILVGFFIGLKHSFRDFSWLIMMLIGSVFLIDRIYPEYHLSHYLVPGIIIFVGLLFILSPRSKHFNRRMERHRQFRRRFRDYYCDENEPGKTDDIPASSPFKTEQNTAGESTEATVDIVSVFSGVRKKILSKNFKGGNVTCFCGGAELNLANADFVSPITLDVTQIFGGTKLVVPANWEVKSDVTAIFGGIEDKRPQPPNTNAERTLILDGTVLFGGVEISSY